MLREPAMDPFEHWKDAPSLAADGITDDTVAIQYYIDHHLPLPEHKTYLVTRLLYVSASNPLCIDHPVYQILPRLKAEDK